MAQPSLIAYFALNGQRDPVPIELLDGGYSPSIPNIHGYQLNSILYQIIENLNYSRSKGLGFWESTRAYYATAGEFDIVRYGTKIYYALQDSNIDLLTPKAPDTNPTYWGVMYDFSKPVYNTFALLGGSATQKFKVATATLTDEAVTLAQLNTKALLGGSATQKFKVATATLTDEAVNLGQLNLKAPISSPAFTGTPTAPTPTNGDNSTKVATTAFAYGLVSKATSGYVKLPNGLILQWGLSQSIAAGSSAAVTFPVAFPTVCLSAHVTRLTSTLSTSLSCWVVYSTPTPTTVTLSNGSTQAGQGYWFAIGY